ncbi:hypothetical protein IEQ34_013908 [Dendrobium chrysotoxum]|uniref:Uncharacterized protein n=1 Tax=Dendrobium chrysotoxum TaxID=161865 RepID=A0AAV7GHG8_DENCH|nr:hypothetical protein IEQ34_013908 [Dendrobium chrysotoxum]
MAAPPAVFTVSLLSRLSYSSVTHSTIFPETVDLLKEPLWQWSASGFPVSPGNTRGSISLESNVSGWFEDSPSISIPFPSLTVALILLSTVAAPTVRHHGASFDKMLATGPKFPAAQQGKMLFLIAENEALATLLSYKGLGSCPMDMERMSTPSAIACSMAARRSLSVPWLL